MEAFLGILGVTCAAASVFGAGLAAKWVLGPLDSAAKNRRHPIQFSLADFLCLFVQVQLSLGAAAALFRGLADKGPVITLTVALILFVLLVWWTGVRTLSRAGVHDTRGRALTLVVGIPLGYAFSIAIPVVAFMVLASLSPQDMEGQRRDWQSVEILIPVEMVIILAVWGLGIMTRRILRAAKPLPATTRLQDLVRSQLANDPTSPPRSET